MRALVIKPHPLEHPGTVGERLREHGVDLVEHVPSQDPEIPPLDGFELLLCFGAPWSVYGEEVRPWIATLLERLRESAELDLPFLGVCFGAQAHAKALGGEVFRAERGELEVGTVDVVEPGPIEAGPWMMWHSDAFTVPPRGRLLATTGSGPQAYTFGRSLLVQFHPEITPEIFDGWCQIGDSDFDRFGVDPAELRTELARRAGDVRARARRLVDAFVAGAALEPGVSVRRPAPRA